jgi:hypothetical protein
MKHIKKRKGWEHKKTLSLEEPLNYNDNTSQNRNGLRILQSYQHALLKEST